MLLVHLNLVFVFLWNLRNTRESKNIGLYRVPENCQFCKRERGVLFDLLL